MRDAGVLHFIGTSADLTMTGDKLVVTALEDLNIIEFGLVVTTAITGGANTLIVAVDKRPIAGSDTNRGAADISGGTVNTSVNIAGDIIRKYLSYTLKKGEQAVVEVTDAAAAGAALPYIRAYPAGAGKVSTHSNGASTTLTDRDFDA